MDNLELRGFQEHERKVIWPKYPYYKFSPLFFISVNYFVLDRAMKFFGEY